ncbi:hypothetical protein ACWGRF_08305 [Streptomyces zhihengii]
MAVGFLEDDVGQGAGGVVCGQQVGCPTDVGGDGAGGAGEQQGDLLQVRGRQQAGMAGPSQHGFDQSLVERTVEGEFGVEVTVWVVEYDVGVAHRAPAGSWSWSWSAAGAWAARK